LQRVCASYNYLPYSPREEGKAELSKLSDDDLIQILNQATPEEWQAVILGPNNKLFTFDFQGTVDYFETLDLNDYAHTETHLTKEQKEKLICLL
jgi:hypothetical protein